MELGDVLREAREGRRLSQAAVGELIGGTAAAVGNYERGQRVPSTLILGLYARAFDMDVGDLRALAKAARKKKREGVSVRRPAAGASPAEKELVFLRNVLTTLSAQIEELSEAVEYLEAESAGRG